VPPEHDAEALGVAEDTRDSVGLLLAAAQGPAHDAPLELVNRAVTMRQDAEDMLAVAVRRARSHGATWEQIGSATSMAADSARGHWSGGQVARALERRRRRAAARARAVPAPAARSVPDTGGPSGAADVTGQTGRRPGPRAPAPGSGGKERRAAEHLALAMSHLRASRHSSARAVAQRMGVSASLLSLVLAGKRLPSWEVTESFARACDTDPDDLVQLWRQAHGIAATPPNTPLEGQALIRTALRGLYLAAREPGLPALGGEGHRLSHDQVACLVDSSVPPPADWPVIARLVSALGGQEEDIRPLWGQAYALRSGVQPQTPPGGPLCGTALPAAAFG
jgi:transcriptional regulator with XRE-family HTH domain